MTAVGLRRLVAGLVSLSLFASILVLATQAEGREATRATSNDGGAWLVDRRAGGAAHVEYTTRQPTAESQVSDPGSQISAVQSPGVVAIHDRTADVVKLIDSANATQLSSTALPPGSDVRTLPAGVAILEPLHSALWVLTDTELTAALGIDSVTPSFVGDEPGRLVVSVQGDVALVLDGRVVWPAEESRGAPRVQELPSGFEPEHVSMAARQVVLVDDDRWLVVSRDGTRSIELSRPVPVAYAQREGADWRMFGVVTPGGEAFTVDLDGGAVTEVGDAVPLEVSSPPILHDGCIHTLGGRSGEMQFAALCLDGRSLVESGLDVGDDAELRLVNGEVWIDALDASGFLLTPELQLEEIADFSEIFDESDGEISADGENVEQRLDQGAVDAALADADELDEDLINEPPVAIDDEDATRLRRPVVVDVLANDSDPDGDVILISGIEILDGETLARVEVPSSANTVQVAPLGEPGTVRFRYTITDGSGETATALATVQILPSTQEGNRPPDAALDRVVGAADSIVSANLLVNDSDPDGDSFILSGLGDSEEATVLSVHPGGDVLLALPATVGSGHLEIPYVVQDEWQAEAEGVLRVTVRLDESNVPPDARNDAGTTQVGRRLTLHLLDNDVDGDNDLLVVGQEPRPVDGSVPGFYATTEDGEFTFEPTEPGTYLFSYSATDREASDLALIRVEVTEPTVNRAPVAVRDDVTLAWGERRLVRALDNDGDLDGDLFAVVDHTPNQNLEIVPDPGVGFAVTMKPGAGPVEMFEYRISDGQLDSELVSVVVARSEEPFQNAPPIVGDDAARVRPGRTSRLFPLRNDYDPEGGLLTLTEASATDGVDVAVSGDGQWLEIRVPAAGQLPFSIQYTVEDEAGNVAAGSIQAIIVPPDEPNSPPIARPDSAYTIEGEPIVVQVLANDADPESDPLTLVSAPRAPIGGSVSLTADRSAFVYRPQAGFRGTDRFTYLIRDSEGAESTGYVDVAVMKKPVQNRPPVAVDDTSWTFVAGGGRVRLDVLDNDDDPDRDPLTIISATGDAQVATSGATIAYDLPDSVTEPQTIGFAYEIADGRGGRDSAEVRIVVQPNVDPIPPVAEPDTSVPVKSGDEVTVDALANDRDPDGDDAALRVVSADGGAKIAGGGLTFTAPDQTAEFAYTIEDADGLQATSYVTVVVEDNLPPVIVSPIVIGQFFTDESIPTIDLADHVSDPDDAIDDLVFSDVAGQIGGTTALDRSSRDQRIVSFAPDPDFQGDAGFSFTVIDPAGNLASGRVTIVLKGRSNQPPVGIDQRVIVEAGVDQPFNLSTLFDDPDVDDTLTLQVTSSPGAEVTLAGSPPVVDLQVPITAPSGETAFTVAATDSEGEEATATVTVTVTESQVGPPITVDDNAEIDQGESVTVDVVTNDQDTLGQGQLVLTNAFLTGAGAGAVSHDDRSITFVSDPAFFGDAQIRYTVSDGRQGSGGDAEGILSIRVLGRPSAPSGVSATAVGPNNVLVSWLAPANNGAPIESYTIRVNGSETVVHNSTTPQYRFDDRTPGESYSFEVLATNQAGDGVYSPATAPVVPDEVPGPPGKPTVAIVPGSPGQLQVTWGEGPNAGSAISEYQLEIGGCGSSKIPVGPGGATTVHTWQGLQNGTPCTFRASAVNQAGEGLAGPWSDQECPADIPGAPSRPTAVRGDKQATVSWSAPTNPDCQSLLGYEILRYRNGSLDGTNAVPFGTVQWTSSPLLNGDTYTFEVRAENRQGWGPASPASAAVIPCGVPLAPPAPSAVRGDQQATVTRNGDAPANGCAVTQYLVRVNGGSPQALPANGVISPLTNGTSYAFTVAGVNEIGTGEFSSPLAAVTPAGAPFAPTITNPVAGGTYEWVINGADPNGDPIIAYQLSGDVAGFSSTSSSGTGSCRNSLGRDCLPTSSASKSPPTACLQNAQTVTVTGSARNSVGTGATATDSLALSGCPAAPSLSVSGGNGQFTANFNRPSGTRAIYVQVNGSYGSPVGGSSKTFSGNNGATYSVTAWACNEFGCNKSATRTVTPQAPPPVIALSRAGPAPAGYWYSVALSGFTPGSSVTVTCRDSVDPGGFWTQTFTISGSGTASDSTLCYSADGPDHWVTGGGVESNHVQWN